MAHPHLVVFCLGILFRVNALAQEQDHTQPSPTTTSKYAYQLPELDSSWTVADHLQPINLSRLSPGDHILMIRSIDSNGRWSNGITTMQLHVNKPFSQTFPFYLLIFLFTGSLFFALYRFRVQQLLRSERVRREISRNLHDEVGSTLSNISLGSLLAQKQLHNQASVNRILERIYQDSQQVSQSMREIVWSIDPNIDTLEQAMPRMLQYASQMLEAKDMELKVDIAPGVGEAKLSMQSRRDLYLIFKETINNLAKHSKASLVNIIVQIVNGKLLMVISDNGIGFNTTTTLQNGLKNMRDRAKTHGWQLQLQSSPGLGTTLELKAAIA